MASYLVVHPYLDIYGGGERVCHNVIKMLLAHGQTVQLLTFDFNAARYKDIVGEDFPKEVMVHSLGKRTKEKAPFTIYKRHRNFVKLLKKYRNMLNYDYLFSTQSSSPFEPVFLDKAKKNFAYVHFPEIHYDYAHARLKRRLYLWLFKRWVEQGIDQLDLVFCNSFYTKENIMRYWRGHGVKEPVVVYPPVNLEQFWSDKPFSQRKRRVVYVARFISAKRHEILKRLAADLPDVEFVSVGGVVEADKAWLNRFSEELPKNYRVKVNLPTSQLIDILQNSRVYVHLMEGEHFGIAPVEGLASGCVTIVHDSGGMKEFIPKEYRWQTYAELKDKIVKALNMNEVDWDQNRRDLWKKIAVLTSNAFQDRVWFEIERASS